jgi:hypothetical protein
MITEQSRRQRADEIMTQAVREIHAVFPQLQIDVFDTGPEREDGLIIVHVPEPGMFDDMWDIVGKLLTDAMLNEDLLIALGTERYEEA